MNKKIKTNFIRAGVVDKNGMLFTKEALIKIKDNIKDSVVLDDFNMRKVVGKISSSEFKEDSLMIIVDIESQEMLDKIVNRSKIRPMIRKIKTHKELINGEDVEVIEECEFICANIIPKEIDIYE